MRISDATIETLLERDKAVTKEQIEAITHLKDDIEAMIGCSDVDGADAGWAKSVKHIKEFLEVNKIAKK